MKKAAFFILVILLITACERGPVNLRLPALIGSNMVLQQKSDIAIWGNANPGKKVYVMPSWGTRIGTRSGKDGKWSVSVTTPQAGGPYKIRIYAADTIVTFSNILMGEVWFCSGQSNMEMPVEGWPPADTIMNSANAIANARYPNIRLFHVARKISTDPLDDCTGMWEVCNPASVRSFSATAFFFGRKLYEKLDVPIGLIESTWGGTPSESWTSADALRNAGEFIPEIKDLKESKSARDEYQAFLEKHKTIGLKPSGEDQWKDLVFGDEAAASPDFNDSSWPVMDLPGLFERVIGDFDGTVWFRKTINLPADFSGKDLILSLGPIDDMDKTWFNGELVGSVEVSGKWKMDRNYEIPAKLVKKGPNIISVRVLDTGGGGGIWGVPGSMKITVKNGKQAPADISGSWKYQPSAELIDDKFYLFDISKNEFTGIKRPKSLGPDSPTVLYNAMVNPVINYRIKGAIWYQGEANVGRADQYAKIFPLMIQNWRDAWKTADFPFYFVQIAPYIYSGVDSTEAVLLREAQAKSLKTPHTGMVVTLDIATVMDIHPPYKTEAGERLANLALNNDYGIKTACLGPVYKSLLVEGNVIKVRFDNAGSGLVSKNPVIPEFEIAGKDGKYVKATARIVRDEVWASSPSVAKPVMVRYCWRNGAIGTLFNSDGLPASEFSAADAGSK